MWELEENFGENIEWEICMKLLSFYLPQFHEIPENNTWWGKGFTEWNNVKNCKPLFLSHYQPRVPLNKDYYDLMDESVMEKQMKLADKYGIYGFCFYHYWFKGKKLLERPIEHLLNNSKANLPFCFAWANEPWCRSWHGIRGEKEVLMRQDYGNREDWKKHFEYLLPFFKDKRYIIVDNKPMFLIYHIAQIACSTEMFKCWNELAVCHGFDGIHIVSMLNASDGVSTNSYVSATVDFEPGKTRRANAGTTGVFSALKQELTEKYNNFGILNQLLCNYLNYDSINEEMLKKRHKKNEYRGVFVDYDDSPRRKIKGSICRGSTPQKFENYLLKNIEKSIEEGNEFMFINAWNEWGESNYLEPDERYGYAYLHAVKRALENVDQK